MGEQRADCGEPLAWIESPAGVRLLTGLQRADPLRTVSDLDRTLAPATVWRALALDYEFGAQLEPRVGSAPSGSPLGWVWSFSRCRSFSPGQAAEELGRMVARLSPDQRVAALADIDDAIDQMAYSDRVAQIQRWIAAGDCYQVNFSFPLRMRTIGHPLALFQALRERQRAPWAACILTGERSILSLSPELFVEKTGSTLRCRPMKGTRPRGADRESDAANRTHLDTAEKDRAENVMIVDLLRNDLGRVATPGSVVVERLFEIESYPTVHQMVSGLRAEAPAVGAAGVIAALFPCGSITGAPKVRAMQIIRELEQTPRGIYTGAIGALAPTGDFALNVAIRTLALEPDGSAVLGIGSGIVADSVAHDEYQECLLKAEFATGQRPPFSLVETLRLEDGRYPRREGHLRRLRESARRLRFNHSEEAVLALLDRLAIDRPSGVHRVRLTLGADGELGSTVQELGGLPAELGFRIAAETIASNDWGLRFKTTRRARYDAALASINQDPELFDLLFCNERGELCEGARSNLFVQTRGRLLTPAEDCGLLPGVLRGELLASGKAVEAVLTPKDLEGAEAIYLGNALRGLIPVAWHRES